MVLRWDNLTLTYQYHGRRTVHGVSGHVRKGECHLLVSDQAPLTGCLPRTLAEWLPPSQEGSRGITWNGHERRPREWFSRIGIVPSHERVEKKFTIREHLLRSVRLRRWATTDERERRRLVEEALEFFELEPVADKPVGYPHDSPQVSPIERKMFLVGKLSVPRIQALIDPMRSPGVYGQARSHLCRDRATGGEEH